MKEKVDSGSSSQDTIKWLLAVVVLAGTSVASYVYHAEPLMYRLIGWVVAAGATLSLIATTSKGSTTIKFVKDAKKELQRVVWPTRKETVQTTLIVFVMVVIMGFMLWGMDNFFMWFVGTLTGQRG